SATALRAEGFLGRCLRDCRQLAASCLRRHPRHDPASIGFVDDAAGRVACVDRIEYVIRETRTEARLRIGELTHVANPEIDAVPAGMSQWKRQRHLRERHTGLARDPRQLFDHVKLALIAGSRQVEPRAKDRIVLAPLPFYEACPRIAWNRGIAPVFPGKPSSIQRAPCQQPHAEGLNGRQDVDLDVPHENRIRRRLGHEALEATLRADRMRLRLVPRGEHRATEVPDLADPYQIGQHVERLLEVGVEIGPMDLVQVDVIGAKAFEARLDLAHDPKPRGTLFIWAIPGTQTHFSGQDDLVAMAGNGFSYDRLRLAM